jgi:hypothetical protein
VLFFYYLPAFPVAVAAIPTAAAVSAPAITAIPAASLLLSLFPAVWASYRLVFKPFFFVKSLLAFGKYKFPAAVFAR